MMMMADSPAWPFNLYFYPHAFGGWNFFHPEQSLVDEFEYLDGSPRRKIKFQKKMRKTVSMYLPTMEK